MAKSKSVKAAAVQAAPIFFDLDACLEKAESIVADASRQGCDLIAFGEAWFPGYPFQIWLGAPAWAMQYTVPYFENSLEAGSEQFQRLCDIARKNNIMLSAGISERSGGSLYLSQVLIDRLGEVVSIRRKLKPTHVERTIYGEGYGKDLVVSETELGNVGQLCCWEHIQPLSKYALYSQHEQIHIAAWPSFIVYRENVFALSAVANMAASRTYALEGQCFVVAASSVLQQQALDFFKVGTETPNFIQLGGGASMIFGPDGKELAGPIDETEEGLVIATLDMDAITMAKAVADPVGHYAKPEATRLLLRSSPLSPVVRDEAPSDEKVVDLEEHMEAAE